MTNGGQAWRKCSSTVKSDPLNTVNPFVIDVVIVSAFGGKSMRTRSLTYVISLSISFLPWLIPRFIFLVCLSVCMEVTVWFFLQVLDSDYLSVDDQIDVSLGFLLFIHSFVSLTFGSFREREGEEFRKRRYNPFSSDLIKNISKTYYVALKPDFYNQRSYLAEYPPLSD